MQFARFADVADLEEEALRALLRGEGDEPERVWAAWALGMRGKGEGKIFGDAAKKEPSPGVRAHLALMLVASGERAAALVLARRDPNAFVREAAWRHLARTSAATDDALNDAIAAALAMEPSPSVRAAILDELPNAVSPLVRARTIGRLDDDALEVQAAAIDFLVRRDDEELSSALLARAPAVSDEGLFRKMIEPPARKLGARAVLAAATAWSPDAAIRLLDSLVAAKVVFTAADVEALFNRDDDDLDVRLAALDAQGVIELPLRRILAVAVRRSFHIPGRLIARLDEANELSAEERRLLGELIASIEAAYEARRFEVPVTEALARLDDGEEDGVPWIPGLDILSALWRARDK